MARPKIKLSFSNTLLIGAAIKLLWLGTAQAQVPVFATQITKENAQALISKGPDAIGGINDWFFTNGTLCGIVSDVDHEGQFSTKGGSLVDLGFCGRADDHFSATHDLLQGSRRRPLDANQVSIEHDEKRATVIVRGSQDGANIVTRYSLSSDQPTQVHISKRLRQQGGDSFNFFSSLNFNYHSLEAFVLNSEDLGKSNGFKAEDFVSRGVGAMRVAARDADTIITLSPSDAEVGIAYGWQLKSAIRIDNGERTQLPRFMLADDSSNAMLVLTDTFYIGDGQKIGWLQLPQFPLLSMNDDTVIETQEVIYVGKRGDVASITDQIFEGQAQVSGRVVSKRNPKSSKFDPEVAAVHVLIDGETPYTHVRTDEQGNYSFRAPAGNYTLSAKASAKRSIERKIVITEPTQAKRPLTALSIEPLILPKAARVDLPAGHAMRLVFVGVEGTSNPHFTDQLTDFSVTEDDGVHFAKAVSNVFLAGVSSDQTYVEIPAGKYTVYATKGPEFSLERTSIVVEPSSQQSLKIDIPKRAISSPDFIASDLHVHSGISFDNAFSEVERVRTFVAEHGEVMVSSEHDVPVDYQPRIEELGVEDKIVSIAAAEVTSLLPTDKNTFTGGHANFFPYSPSPLEYRRGMVNHEDKRWREIIHEIKQQQGSDILVQLNHARLTLALSGELPSNWEELAEDGNFFDHMGAANHPYNPNEPLHSHPNNSLIEPHEHTGVRDIDIDLFEVINPGGEHNQERIQALRKDWLSLLKQGERIVATANSDSHTASEQVAVPRTMVAMENDSVIDFNQSEFISSLKSGNAYGTTGPLLNISLSGAQMGGTFQGPRGQLSLRVDSASWITVDQIKVQINGLTVDQYKLNPGNSHTLLVPLSFDKDSFVTVEISGPATQEYQAVYPDLTPYAYSNPIYVDFDSDGKWQAPGL